MSSFSISASMASAASNAGRSAAASMVKMSGGGVASGGDPKKGGSPSVIMQVDLSLMNKAAEMQKDMITNLLK